ncbi:MAG: DUF3833 domain-containing protein [Alphaproteobacteria bacterium]
MNIEDFAGREPELRLTSYFEGRSRAWGAFFDRFGTVRRQFTVDLEGTVEGDTLTLVEDFVYDDGETERRVWTIRRTGPGIYEGTAAGVVGTATGVARGSAANLRYRFDLPVGDGVWRVSFDDWFLLQPDGVLINRARVSKFGLAIGEVYVTFVKTP